MQKHASQFVFSPFLERPVKADLSPITHALTVTGWLIVGVSFIFTVFPTIDLTVSSWFAKDGNFILGDHVLLRGLRDYSRLLTKVIVWSMVLLTALCIACPRGLWRCAAHKPLFVLTSFFAGPVVVVEALKFAIGRARPRHLIDFGGSADFTPVWEFAAACSHNCSFPSGEAAGAAAALSLLVFVSPRYRALTASMVTPVLIFVAMNRVAFGAHFLSDVVLAWLITLFIMLLIWRWTQVRSQDIDDRLSGVVRRRAQ
ncbi:phosphatase PAP2 family protein [Agrobacterium sp. DE0009]|uniref:phosphatase PAP2 family protein n=1 Tax=Agrobacterium sp. DE0009 TaxID=2587505 RepID=UPI001AED63DE|nr:phosphatase PAP2 family protein [Agrobacterium sp. DE0009]